MKKIAAISLLLFFSLSVKCQFIKMEWHINSEGKRLSNTPFEIDTTYRPGAIMLWIFEQDSIVHLVENVMEDSIRLLMIAEIIEYKKESNQTTFVLKPEFSDTTLNAVLSYHGYSSFCYSMPKNGTETCYTGPEFIFGIKNRED